MIRSDIGSGTCKLARSLGRPVIAAGLVLCLAAASACSDSGSGESGKSGAGAAGAGGGQQASKVGIITVEPKPVTITANVAGRVVAFQTAQVRPQVGGLITERLFDEGAKVEKGDVLYKLDDRSYQAQVDSAEATLQKNEAALASAKLQYERYQNLTASNVVSQSDRDDALSTYRQAQADVAVANAELETARLNLDYTSIKAPIAGRVGTDPADPGNLVTADQTDALATIRQIDPVYVDFTESSGNLLKFRDQIKRGGVKALVGPDDAGKAKVKIRFADGSTYPIAGTIDAADQFVSETTSSFTVRTRFSNPENALLPGMYVRGTITLAIADQGILLPQMAVSRNGDGQPTAMFVKTDGTVETRVLEVSTDIGTNWLVTKGAKAGDRLVVDGTMKVRDGAKVEVVPVRIDENGRIQPANDKGEAKPSAAGGQSADAGSGPDAAANGDDDSAAKPAAGSGKASSGMEAKAAEAGEGGKSGADGSASAAGSAE